MTAPLNLPESVDVIIVGAGPAGLTAAYLLVKAGKSVVVLEANPDYVGGISRTENYNGYRFDIGGHRFYSRSAEVNAFWHEILPQGFELRQRRSRIYYNGKFYQYPLQAFQALLNLGLWRSTACMASYLKWQFFPVRPARSFRDWVSNQFGAKLFEIFFKTYTEKVWGMRCEDISADWAAQRIKSLNLARAIINSLIPQKASVRNPTSLIDQFYYPRLGPGMMWETVRDKVLATGGQIILGAPVTRLERVSEGWCVTSGMAGLSIKATHVISSAPLRELMAGLVPAPQTLSNAMELKYRDFITVALMLDAPVPFNDNWIYIHDPAVKVGRVQNFGAWSPAMLPTQNVSCLGLEYFCFEGDGLWTMTDADLIALAEHELKQLGLCGTARVMDGKVVRQPKAYPVYDDSYKFNLQAIRAELEQGYANLHVIGRNGMHRYNNQDHSMLTAMLTVKNILEEQALYDVWSVNEEASYVESGVRAVPTART